MSDDIRVGDKVRVIFEGRVLKHEPQGSLRITSGYFVRTSLDQEDVRVELVARRAPELGEEVAGVVLDDLPVGTVLADRLVKHANGRWVSLEHEDVAYDSRGLTKPRAIKYLP